MQIFKGAKMLLSENELITKFLSHPPFIENFKKVGATNENERREYLEERYEYCKGNWEDLGFDYPFSTTNFLSMFSLKLENESSQETKVS